MHIAIDARVAGQRPGGIARYARELSAALAVLPSEFSFTLLESRRGGPVACAPGLCHRRALTPAHHRWEGVALGLELLRVRPALLHSVDFIPPSIRCFRSITTIHDLAFLRWPEILDQAGRRYYGQIYEAAHNADSVIAVSNATREDLINLLGVPVERITVIPEGASQVFQPLPTQAVTERLVREPVQSAVRDLVLGRHGRYFLVVGTIEPRKNLPYLLRAYADLRAAWPAAPRLVVVGREGWLAGPTLHAMAQLRTQGYVDWLQEVSTPELALLYGASVALLFPSRYEGFGLPALEAMASGAPVLAADTSALRELVDQAGWLLPIDDVTAWVDAMHVVATDEAVRDRLRESGLRRAACFSWSAAAQSTLTLYRQVLANA